MKVHTITQTAEGLILDSFIRIAGEPHSNIQLHVSSNSPVWKICNTKRATSDLEYSYFRIETNEKIPEARPVRLMPRLDIVTKDVMSDLTLNENYRRKQESEPKWDGHLNPFSLRDTAILSFTEITQNDFLGIKPKIVKPENK